MDAELELDSLVKRYGKTVAVDGVSLSVPKGQLLSLLGPSGCGKTTTLRMIGGFIEPTSGRVRLRGRDVTDVAPYHRDTAMVFQSYALFPHLSAADNIAFGLRERRLSRQNTAERVRRYLALLGLEELGKRMPRELSGGQQQRVAVARALALEPAVLLMDEPFSNLDAALRESTRVELRRIQQELSTTTIVVTHDQEEALAISDQIAVMNRGRIEQIGVGTEIYQHPHTPFVASFVGAANIFTGEVWPVTDGSTLLTNDARLVAATRLGIPGSSASAAVRAENIRAELVSPENTTTIDNSCVGRIEVSSYLGVSTRLVVALPSGKKLTVRGGVSIAEELAVGAWVRLRWDPSAVLSLATNVVDDVDGKENGHV